MQRLHKILHMIVVIGLVFALLYGALWVYKRWWYTPPEPYIIYAPTVPMRAFPIDTNGFSAPNTDLSIDRMHDPKPHPQSTTK